MLMNVNQSCPIIAPESPRAVWKQNAVLPRLCPSILSFLFLIITAVLTHSFFITAMTSSQALIPWEPVANNGAVTIPENSYSGGGRWALFLNAFLSPSPGRTLNHVYSAAGKVLETHANRVAYKLGLGPHVIAGKIKLHFGDKEHRMHQLELLRTTVPPKLKKQCFKLMKYTLPCVYCVEILLITIDAATQH
jgi:hypothetical protein